VGKGGKRKEFSLMTQIQPRVRTNMVNLPPKYQFTTQQVRKGGEEQISTHHTKSNLEYE